MLNKPYYFYGFILCLSLGIGIFPAHAASCTHAKIYKTEGIDKILILRAQGKEEFASPKNRKLCVGDKVIMPNSTPPLLIEIRYYQPRYKVELNKGDEHVVCGFNLLGLRCFLASIPVVGQVVFKGSKPNEPIFMPLAAGKKANSPFYLFSPKRAIPLVWYGGQSPYQIEVKDATGQVIVQQQVVVPSSEKRATFSLTVPHTNPTSAYTLTIQSDGSKPLHKTLKFIEPPQFAYEDQWMKLVSLLADCDQTGKNWRLEIWRQLSAMPDSDQKKNFMEHLEKNDLKPSDFLCQ